MKQALKSTVTFSDEQSMLLDTATEFFRAKSPISYVREQLASDIGFDQAVWDEMVGLGWAALAIPEAHGGIGMGLAEAVTIAEPMGRQLFASPFLSTQLFVQGVLAADETLKTIHLPKIAEGKIGTVALFEQDGNWDLETVAAVGSLHGDRVRLAGVKTFVCDAAVADMLLVSVRLEGQPALVVVPRDTLGPGALSSETVIDQTRRSYQLTLDGIEVGAGNVVRGGAAVAGLNAIRDAALLLSSAEAAGGIAGALDIVVDYLNTRTAFGRRIGGYQSLKHPTVDILIGLERSRSHVYHAASLIAAGEDAEVALRMAKAESTDSYAFAGDRAIQFHGGFGFTFECDAQLYLRRALWCQYAFGDGQHHRKRLASLLL